MLIHGTWARRLGPIALASLMAAALLAYRPGLALAAKCALGQCDGWNPSTSGCAVGAREFGPQVDSMMFRNGVLVGYTTLRYSPTCGTVWARSYNLSNRSLYIYSYVLDISLMVKPYWQRDKVTGPTGYSFMDQMVSITPGHRYVAQAVMCISSSCPSGPYTSWGVSVTASF